MITKFYEQFECSIILDNQLSEWFKVESGVRQGCGLSPILFLVTVNWILRKTTEDKPRGIRWNLMSHLEDLDIADDIDLLSSSHMHMQQKTNRLNNYARQVGLNISTAQTQFMQINSTQTASIKVNNEPRKSAEDFTYQPHQQRQWCTNRHKSQTGEGKNLICPTPFNLEVHPAKPYDQDQTIQQ